MQQVSMVGNDLEFDAGIGVCGKAGQSVPVVIVKNSFGKNIEVSLPFNSMYIKDSIYGDNKIVYYSVSMTVVTEPT